MLSGTTADISIICANFNNGRYLEACIESVAAGTMLPKEMIVVDDGSTDYSAKLLFEKAEKYAWLRPVILDSNVGVANASNIGIAQATGKYIMRLDSDDMVLPERVEKQFSFLEENHDIDVLGGNCIYIDADTQQAIRRSAFPLNHKQIRKLFKKGENGVLNGTTMIKGVWFKQFQYRQEMVWAEDYDFFGRLMHAGARFAAIPQPLTLVRIHKSSATSNIRYDTLEKAWKLSKELFSNTSPKWLVRLNYHHLYWYRKSMLAQQYIPRISYLAIASLLRLDKVIKHLFNSDDWLSVRSLFHRRDISAKIR